MIDRVEKIQAQLDENQALVVLEGSNRFYFTGFKSSAGLVVITPQRAVFLIDFRYYEKAKNNVIHMDVQLSTNAYKQMSEILSEDGIEQIFVETEYISVAESQRLEEALNGVCVLKEDSLQKAISSLRAVKSTREIGLMKEAQKITDRAFSYILERLEVGRSEKEIALDLEFFARKNSADGVAFDFIVVSGKNSSLPHGVPSDKKLNRGDFLTMDFGVKVNGYCSDMTRTVAIGAVSDKQKLVYDTVLQAQKRALDVIKAGKVCREVDAVARDYITECGFGDCFGHGLGHGIGIDVHEGHAFNTRDTTVLKEGNVLSVEPGIYLENEFGVRIEDLVVVKNNGCENLTNSPKELIIL